MKTKRELINEKISKSLKGRGNPKSIKICEHCQTKFEVEWRKRNQRFCSRSCRAKSIKFSTESIQKMSISKSGENNPMFGVSPKNTKKIEVYSEKHLGNKQFLVRSTYEKEYVDTLTSNPKVVSFEYEPRKFKCKYFINGKYRTYQPDFLVNEIDREYVIEIKASWQIESEETQLKANAFRSTHLINYEIITDTCRKSVYGN
jgi:hypothetical protein